jgi:hypothetical protein
LKLNDTMRFVFVSVCVQVCDGNDICSFYEADVTVLEKATFTEAEVTAFISNQVDTPKFAGDFTLALTNLNLMADRGLVSRRRRRRRREAAETTSDTTADQLDLIQLTIDETVMTSSSAQLVLDQTASVDPSTMDLSDQSDFVDQLSSIIDVFIDEGVPIPSGSATIVSGKLDVISDGLDPEDNEALLSKISDLRSQLSQSLASGLSVGSPRSEIQGSNGVSGVMRTLLSDPLDSKSTGTPISISFGSELSALFGPAWTCSSGEACSGVTLKLQHYDSDVDLLSTDQEDIDNRVADILDIILADPESDEKLNVSGLAEPVELGFTLNSSPSETDLTCVYWDTSISDWSTNEVSTTDNGDGTVTCGTTHLTTFTVMAVPWVIESTTVMDEVTEVPVTEGLSTNLIIIIAASSGFGLFLLLIVGIFMCKQCGRKNKVENASSSSSSEQQERQPPSSQPPQQQEQPPQQPPQQVVAVIGIPMVQGQYGMGMATQPMGMAAQPMAMAPVDHSMPVYDLPPAYSSSVGVAPAAAQQPYSSTVAAAPPQVTLVGQNNNLMQVGMATEPAPPSYESKASKSGEMSSYMTAVTGGLPGIGQTSDQIPLKSMTGSKSSLTGHR